MLNFHAFLWVVALLSCLPFNQIFVAGSSSSDPSSSYTSVRALDKYGESEQVQNALKAANLQGTLVVAARAENSKTTIVLSLLESPKNTGRVAKDPAMLHMMNQNPAFVTGTSSAAPVRTALVCTGLKGDAQWLIQKVRAYSHRVWERYNQFLDAPGAAYAVSKFTTKFWRYSEDSEWQPGLLLADEQSREARERNYWGRPLGVVTMVLSSSLPYVFVVEPSGVVSRYTAFAMGKRSGEILEKLHATVNGEESTIKKSDDNQEISMSNDDDLKERLIILIRETIGSTNKDMNILVEELSEQGVHRSIVPLAKTA